MSLNSTRTKQRSLLVIDFLVVSLCLVLSLSSTYFNTHKTLNAMEKNYSASKEREYILFKTIWLGFDDLAIYLEVDAIPALMFYQGSYTNQEIEQHVIVLRNELSKLNKFVAEMRELTEGSFKSFNEAYSNTKRFFLSATFHFLALIIIYAIAYFILWFVRKKRRARLIPLIGQSFETSLIYSIGFSVQKSATASSSMRVLYFAERIVSFVYIILILGALIALLV